MYSVCMVSDSIPPNLPPSTPTDPANPGAPQKSPLDILEDILGKDPNAAGAAVPDASPAPADAPPSQPQPTLEEIRALEQEMAVRDQAALAAKQAEMASITESPEYQVRVTQDEAAAEQTATASDALEGFEIKQLDHTKIAE